MSPFKKISNLFCSLAILFAGGQWSFLHVGHWLSLSEEPWKSDVIICLSGNKNRELKAVKLFRRGYADTILVTYVETRKWLTEKGVPDAAVINLDGKPESTFEEAMDVIQFMHTQNLHSAIIVSDSYHMYRVKWTYDHLTDVEAMQLTYVASDVVEAKRFWWDDQKSRRFVLSEIPKVVYYWIAHGMLGVKYDPQWVNDLERWYGRTLSRFV